MSIKAYIKDHGVLLGIWIFSVVVIEGLLLLFHGTETLQIFVLAIEVLALLGAGGYEYSRKRRFYAHMKNQAENLREKYLLLEMLEKPEFLDGMIFYETMTEMEKSMNDEIYSQIRKNNEFKRYVETWVHEVKLPIAGIRLLLHDYRGDSSRIFKEQMGRIENYVEQVLYYLRSEVPEKDYLIQEYSLRALTDRAVSEHKDSLILNHMKIVQETEDTLVCTDEKWLHFMLGQILSNAVKYKKRENSQIRLWSEKEGHKTMLHIWDNGMGIPQKDLPRVFEKSFTGENGRRGQASTGMGLYLCKTLCERLGHKLDIDAKQGVFTELVITFQTDAFIKFL